MRQSTFFLKSHAFFAIDATTKVVRQGKVAGDPEALIAWFRALWVELARIGLRAGPLSTMALCGHAAGWSSDGALGDAARAQRVQDHWRVFAAVLEVAGYGLADASQEGSALTRTGAGRYSNKCSNNPKTTECQKCQTVSHRDESAVFVCN